MTEALTAVEAVIADVRARVAHPARDPQFYEAKAFLRRALRSIGGPGGGPLVGDTLMCQITSAGITVVMAGADGPVTYTG